jgi:hypothetical protein
VLPALEIDPCRRCSPEEYSEGIRPKNFISSRGVSNRVRSPISATRVTATVNCTPRKARIEPVATGASLIDKDEVFGFRWHLTDELIDVTRSCPHGAQGGDLSAMSLGDIRDGNRIVVDIHSDKECARVRPG